MDHANARMAVASSLFGLVRGRGGICCDSSAAANHKVILTGCRCHGNRSSPGACVADTSWHYEVFFTDRYQRCGVFLQKRRKSNWDTVRFDGEMEGVSGVSAVLGRSNAPLSLICLHQLE